jgi:hypothetical protein
MYRIPSIARLTFNEQQLAEYIVLPEGVKAEDLLVMVERLEDALTA